MALKASIDIGTNSTRLLIVDISESRAMELIEYHERLTKLGQGLQDGILDEACMRRVVNALVEFKQVMRGYDIVDVRPFATSAARDAKNRNVFLDKIREETGLDVRLLSGNEEANLSCLGVLSDYHGSNCIVCDVGGGSTEFISVFDRKINSVKSLDVGSRRMTRQFLISDPPQKNDIVSLRQFIRQQMQAELAGLELNREIVAVGGTAAALALMDAELSIQESYQAHHYRLSSFGLEKIILDLMQKSIEERKAIVGLHPKRADVILGGALIFAEIYKYMKCDKMIVSLRDLMFGVFLE